MIQTIGVGDGATGKGEHAHIVAEVCSNHDSELEEAKRLIHIASEAGVIKFQAFKSDKKEIKKGELFTKEMVDLL